MKKKKALKILKDIRTTCSKIGVLENDPDHVYYLEYDKKVHKALKKAIKVMEKEV